MEKELLYQERLKRYTTALRNGKPDRVPIRPFAAEFAARYAGFTCQEVTHDFEKAFEAVRVCARDFDWDAVVANMVYVWTGLTDAIGLRYYGVPGLHVPADTGFQYREPPEGQEFMKADEYDRLIDDPTAFLYDVWLPRVAESIRPSGEPAGYRHNLALVKGGMAMMKYFYAFGPQVARLRSESGTVSAIAGILKAPFDIIADKLRGYIGLTMDMIQQPQKVRAACEALIPHLFHVAWTTADPEKNVPIGYWMHRGCVPFIRKEWFDTHYWPTIKPIIQALWARGHQTMFYAEGNWNAHLDRFAELPDGCILYHVDQADLFEVHRRIGHKFCLSGGIPNYLLSYRSPQEVRDFCRKVVDEVAADGGYIADASAIMQNDTSVENIAAMTDFLRDYGTYSSSPDPAPGRPAAPPALEIREAGIPAPKGVPPGVCVPWEQRKKELPPIQGEEALFRRIWEENESLAHTFIWQCLLSF